MHLVLQQQDPAAIVGTIPPPPGVIPNFNTPASRQWQLVSVNWATLGCMLLFVSMRLWTRVRLTRYTGWDDYLCVVALLCLVVHFIAITQVLKHGMGIHMWELRKDRFKEVSYINWSRIGYAAYLGGLALIRISVLLLYVRIFETATKLRRVIYVAVILMVANLIGAALLLVFFWRVSAADVLTGWGRALHDTQFRIGLTQSILNLIWDLVVVVLPIPTIWSLQLPLRQRLTSLAVLAAGLLACIAGAFRLYFIFSLKNPDLSWRQLDNTVWGIIEMNIAMICSCLPAVKPFTSHMASRITQISSAYTHRRKSSAEPFAIYLERAGGLEAGGHPSSRGPDTPVTPRTPQGAHEARLSNFPTPGTDSSLDVRASYAEYLRACQSRVGGPREESSAV